MHRAVIFTALAGSAILVTGLVATGNATVPSHRVAADQSRNPRPSRS